MTALVSARGVSKEFAGVPALADVSFDVQQGEVHALIGENGAGKSTLVRILCGAVTDYRGSIAVNGVDRRFSTPRQALAAGIAVIPQELQLVTSLSVAENILLGHEPRRRDGLIDRNAMLYRARERLHDIGVSRIDAAGRLGALPAADRQLVAIARAISLDARCLIMDEPTASLGANEAAHLEQVIRRLVERGAGVIYVSHKLDEVRRLADRVTVLRDGVRVAMRPAAGLDEPEMVRLMCGRQLTRGILAPIAAAAPDALVVESLSVSDPDRPDGYRLHEISFAVRRGEIVGLAGLVGAGRTDLLLALVGGLDRVVKGRIRLDGKDFVPSDPAGARDAGMVLLPEERQASGIFPNLATDRNVTMSALSRVSRFGWIDLKAERRAATRMMSDTGVRCTDPAAPIRTLSGGNQQKALLARCLFASPRMLLLDEPTRGIDLGAKAEIYAELGALAAAGFGIVVCSSEMSEILTHCHRVLVFRRGRIVSEFDRADATEEKVLAAATGTGEPVTGDADGSAPPPTGSSAWRRRIAASAGRFGLLLVMLLAIITSPVRGGRLVFLDLGNLTDILRQVAEKGILAVGMTAVVISGGIDLSVGSVLAFAATMSAWLWMREGVGFGASVALVTAAGAAWGALNGALVSRWRLPAFIATLATMSAARGAARYLSGGAAVPLGFGPGAAPASVRTVAAPLLGYLPAPAIIFGLAAITMHIYLARTRSGRYVYAIGDNEAAARLAGIRVAWHKSVVYVLCGALAAVAGLVHAAQLEQGNPNDGISYELDAIAAVVIGGTTLSGGTGTVTGTIVGILIIGIINNAMGLNNVDANLQLILKGVIIVSAVWLQRRRPAT